MGERYTIEEFVREIAVEEYLARFHNPAEVWSYCRACGNYGKPCCYPDLVRPSLEAYGFNVARTLSELFDIELQWSKNGSLPEYLVLVCGVLYNAVVYL